MVEVVVEVGGAVVVMDGGAVETVFVVGILVRVWVVAVVGV